MKFKRHKILNYSYFIEHPLGLIVIDKNVLKLKLLSYNLEEVMWEFDMKAFSTSFKIIKEEWITFIKEGEIIRIDPITGEYFRFDQLIYEENKNLQVKLNLETQREIFFTNFKTNETKLLKFDYANRYFSNFIALVDGPILTCMDLNENNWSFDFTEHSEYNDVFNGKLKDGEVQAIFSILEKIIVVVSLRWKITAFEVETGKILWEHSFDDKLPLYYVEFQNVFHVFNDRYYEIDGETGTIINERNLLKELQEESIRIYWLTHPARTSL